MTPFKIIALAVAVGAFSAGSALAADAVGPVSNSAPEPYPVYGSDQFDWNRFYAGVMGVGQDAAGTWEYGAGVVAGVNVQHEYFLFGAEAALLGLTDGALGRAYGQVLGRGGLVVTDEAVIYGALGYGADFGAGGDQHILAGGGLEYAVTDDVSVRAQYLHGFGATAGSTDTSQVTFGLNYHF